MSRQVKLVLVTILLLTLFFLLTPFVVRTLQGNNALLGQESYFHLGVAQNILVPDSYPLGDVQVTLFDGLVALLISFFHPLLVGKLFPIFLGLIAMVLFFVQSRKILVVDEQAASSILLLISPLFLVMFSSLSPFGFILVIALFAWWVFDFSPVLSMFITGILIFVNVWSFIFTVLLLFMYGLIKGHWRSVAVGGSVGLSIIIFLDGFFGFFASLGVISSISLNDFFVSLGADFGYSFFILFLALTGFIASWSKKKSHVIASIFLAALFVVSFSSAPARVLFLPISALLAGKGVMVLVRRKWSIHLIRNVSLFLIILSLLFTLVFTISDRLDADPSLEKIEALQFLQSVPVNEVVLSSGENGIFIERIGRRSAFIDNVKNSYSWEREVTAHRIFMSPRMSVAYELLVEQGISHILIDEDMRNGGVWTHEEQGLLFLLDHNSHFVKLYDAGGVSVYRFIIE